jgi:hypothetical protein
MTLAATRLVSAMVTRVVVQKADVVRSSALLNRLLEAAGLLNLGQPLLPLRSADSQ